MLKRQQTTTIQYDYLGNQISSEENGDSENQHVRVHKRDYILTMDIING